MIFVGYQVAWPVIRDDASIVPYRLFFRFAANVLCFSPADEGIPPYRILSRAFYYLPPISNT